MFLTATSFNGMEDITRTNCLAFALGQVDPSENSVYSEYCLDTHDCDGARLSIGTSFKWKCSCFGLDVKEVASLEETEGKTAFLVFGWYPRGDFHIVRKNPDGRLEHKPDWFLPAKVTTLEELYEEYPEGYLVYVLEEN